MDSLMAAGEGWLGGAGPALGAEEISHGLEELIYGSSICPAVSSRRRTGLLALSRTPPLALASASLPLVRILASASGSCAHRARHLKFTIAIRPIYFLDRRTAHDLRFLLQQLAYLHSEGAAYAAKSLVAHVASLRAR